MGRKVNMLSKVKGGKKREKLRGEVIRRSDGFTSSSSPSSLEVNVLY